MKHIITALSLFVMGLLAAGCGAAAKPKPPATLQDAQNNAKARQEAAQQAAEARATKRKIGTEPAPTPISQLRLTLRLSAAPMSRIVCSLSNDKHSLRPAVEWSARSADELVQTVVLDGVANNWQLSCSGDPFKLRNASESADRNMIWKVASGSSVTLPKPAADSSTTPPKPAADSSTTPPKPAADSSTTPKDAKLETIKLSLYQLKDASFTPVTNGDLTIEGEVTTLTGPARLHLQPGIITTPGQRSFEGASEIVAELLQIITEIALERAKAGAFNLVRDALEHAACEMTDGKDILAPDKQPLKETCNAIRSLRMQDLSTAVTVLRDALLRDLTGLALKALRKRLGPALDNYEPVIAYLGDALLSGVRTGSVEIDPRKLVEALHQSWSSQCKDGDRRLCLLSMAAQLALTCSQSAYACSAEQVMHIIEANGVFATKSVGSLTTAEVNKLRKVVRVIVEAMIPRQSDTPEIRVRRAVEAGFALLATLRDCNPDGSAGTAPDKTAGTKTVGPDPVCTVLRPVEQLMIALIQKDLAGAISAGAEAVSLLVAEIQVKGNPALLRKVTRVAGTVAAYAATFKTKPKTEEERKAQYEARKELIAELIDEMTRRAERGGDWVVSLGVLPGFFTGGHRLLCDSLNDQGDCVASTEFAPPQLVVGLGPALQLLPSEDCAFGFHLGATLIDLGQFVAVTEDGQVADPTWATLFSPGLQVGALVGTAESNLFIGADARMAPGIFTRDADPTAGGGAIRFGGTIAYYVPLLDLN